MATLNGAEFEIIEIEWSTYQNNVIQEILGSDTVEVQNQGHGSDPVRIQGMVNNEKEMDDFQEQFYSNGALTLIKDPGTNRQYQVYALGSVKRESISNSLLGTGIIFTCMIQLKYPYSESVDTITRSKSITTQNQEYSADDNGIDIKTEGNVDAVPDIQLTGGISSVYARVNTEPISEPSFETIVDWNFTNSGPISGERTSSYSPTEGTYAYRIYCTSEYWSSSWGQIDQDIDLTNVELISFDYRMITAAGGSWATQVLIDSTLEFNHTGTLSTDTGWITETIDVSGYTGIHTIKLKGDVPGAGSGINFHSSIFDNLISKSYAPTKDPEIYNTADTSLKCFAGNEILDGAIHRINADGTGTINFDDDFTTGEFSHTLYDSLNVSHDTGDDELDIADDGYIYWKCDTKYPIDGIPTLTSRINITTGIPTIQISSDGSTWYDIDTAIVDDVETEYSLDSDGNLYLAGKTVFYWRYDCIKAATATCSIKYFELDVSMHTIYAKNPKITKGAIASTFRADQDADSNMACTIDLIFKNRWWV